jgi:hypothetical protein
MEKCQPLLSLHGRSRSISAPALVTKIPQQFGKEIDVTHFARGELAGHPSRWPVQVGCTEEVTAAEGSKALALRRKSADPSLSRIPRIRLDCCLCWSHLNRAVLICYPLWLHMGGFGHIGAPVQGTQRVASSRPATIFSSTR